MGEGVGLIGDVPTVQLGMGVAGGAAAGLFDSDAAGLATSANSH